LKPAVAKLSPIPRTTAFVKALAEDVVLAKKIVPDVAPGVTTPNPLPAVAHDNILKAQTRLTKNANKHRHPHPFKVGDMVMVSTKELDLENFTTQPNHALSARFIGPYRILKAVGETSFRVQYPAHVGLHPVIHASQLKLYHTPEAFPDRPPVNRAVGRIPTKDDWLVKSIVGHCMNNQVREYLVSWRDRPSSDHAWVPGKNLENAHDLLAQYDMPGTPVPLVPHPVPSLPRTTATGKSQYPLHARHKHALGTKAFLGRGVVKQTTPLASPSPLPLPIAPQMARYSLRSRTTRPQVSFQN